MSTFQLRMTESVLYTLWSWERNDVHISATVIEQIGLRVYRILSLTRGERTQKRRVMKLAVGSGECKEMNDEIETYDRLRELQGSVIPVLYTAWKGSHEGTALACMVLEDVQGQRTVGRDEIDQQTMSAARRLHRYGIVHGNPTPNHFLTKGGRVRVVDFTSCIEHVCAGPGRCQELCELAERYGEMTNMSVYSSRL